MLRALLELIPGPRSVAHVRGCAGDAKAVLARLPEGATGLQAAAPKAYTLTKEHKALLAAERVRIQKQGGRLVNGRLEGETVEHIFCVAHPVSWEWQGHQGAYACVRVHSLLAWHASIL